MLDRGTDSSAGLFQFVNADCYHRLRLTITLDGRHDCINQTLKLRQDLSLGQGASLQFIYQLVRVCGILLVPHSMPDLRRSLRQWQGLRQFS
jgi:hypothetical protein